MLKLLLAVCILCGLMATGCSTKYYRVTDPGFGEILLHKQIREGVAGGRREL